jgi:hypothetical protein
MKCAILKLEPRASWHAFGKQPYKLRVPAKKTGKELLPCFLSLQHGSNIFAVESISQIMVPHELFQSYEAK